MSCPSREQLAGYCNGRLPASVAQAIAAHLDSCARCEAQLAELEKEGDSVVELLRQPVAQNAFFTEPECQQALSGAKAGKAGQPAAKGPTGTQAGLGQIREYRLLEKLGEGGMGVVYKALHTKLDKLVAIKVLPAGSIDDPQRIARFGKEMKAIGKLEDPHIVRAMDAGQVGNRHYLVMEYVDGINLSELLRRSGKLRIADACELVRQAAMGLRTAEAHGLVHRDIKPSNLILDGDGQVKILDLGLATFHSDGPSAEDDEEAGQVMGTPDYMAPEQASASPTIDIRADIYSLGCTLYRLLTGDPPFSGPKYQTKLAKLMAHVNEPVPPIRAIRSDVPEKLAAVLDRMLAKDPGARYPRPGQVADDLRPFCAGADPAGLFAKAGATKAVPDDTDRSRAVTHAPPVPKKSAAVPERPLDAYHKWLGIPPEEQPPNHYRLLGIKLFEDDRDVIDTAVAQRAGHLRTYQLGKNVALSQQLLKEVHVAKVCLMDPEKKAAYDAQLKGQVTGDRGQGKPGTGVASPGWQPGNAGELLDPALSLAIAEAARQRRPAIKRSAPWRKIPGSPAIATAAGAAAIFVLGVIIYWHTDYGTVKIELSDPNAKVEVTVDGRQMDIAGLKDPIHIEPGPHELKVTAGDYETFTKIFAMRRGGEQVLRVVLVAKADRQRPADTSPTSESEKPKVAMAPQPVPPVPLPESGAGRETPKPPPAPSPPPQVPSPQSPAPALAVAPFDEKQAKAHQEAWAKHLGVSVEMTNSIGIKFVVIPPGEFLMGSPDSEKDRNPKSKEGPQHRVRITRPFCLGMYEVTQAEYERVMDTNPSVLSSVGRRAKTLRSGEDTNPLPVESVLWEDAVEFCRRLSQLQAEKAAQHVYRLPTEAE